MVNNVLSNQVLWAETVNEPIVSSPMQTYPDHEYLVICVAWDSLIVVSRLEMCTAPSHRPHSLDSGISMASESHA